MAVVRRMKDLTIDEQGMIDYRTRFYKNFTNSQRQLIYCCINDGDQMYKLGVRYLYFIKSINDYLDVLEKDKNIKRYNEIIKILDSEKTDKERYKIYNQIYKKGVTQFEKLQNYFNKDNMISLTIYLLLSQSLEMRFNEILLKLRE